MESVLLSLGRNHDALPGYGSLLRTDVPDEGSTILTGNVLRYFGKSSIPCHCVYGLLIEEKIDVLPAPLIYVLPGFRHNAWIAYDLPGVVLHYSVGACVPILVSYDSVENHCIRVLELLLFHERWVGEVMLQGLVIEMECLVAVYPGAEFEVEIMEVVGHHLPDHGVQGSHNVNKSSPQTAPNVRSSWTYRTQE
ncbi:hypothetical protein PIB30_032387 [Stylosanthes scabra]|uniref:Uncharacterized protein n=1 Tax=Stylosanthes scabra TaxID=79078 RepID=A0ABU6WA63_9FABA|nr:hypothetical protein [Stylosanthes scabra]